MNNLLRYFSVLGVVVTLSACGGGFKPLKKQGEESQPPIEQKAPDVMGQVDQAVDEGSLDKFVTGDELEVSALSDQDSPLSQRILFFALDSSQIDENDQNILIVHAEFLVAHPEITLVLEGHADERGTREYNIALGEKRAKTVMQLMTLQGVNEKQIQVISFGEERPAALGHDSSAWKLNRRVEILYTGY